MKTIQEIYKSLNEAVEIETRYFEFAHGKKPSGWGGWYFSKFKDIDFSKHKEGKDYYIAPSGTYGDAKKAAIKWAKENNINLLYVAS